MKTFEWTHSLVIGMSRATCVDCRGCGLGKKWGRLIPCKCVSQSIFREVMSAYRDHQRLPVTLRCSLERLSAPSGPINHPSRGGWKGAEFSCDVENIARHALTPFLYFIFRAHYVMGKKAGEVQRLVGLNRNQGYYHQIERVEIIAGRAFAECQPYPLWSVSSYFRGTDDVIDISPRPITRRYINGIPLVPPLRPKPPVPAVVEMPTAERRTGLLCRRKEAA